MSALYFVQEGTNGPVKIGLSFCPEKRLSYLQVGNPRPLNLVAVWPDSCLEEERELHHFHRGEHLHGEWFRPTVLHMAEAGATL